MTMNHDTILERTGQIIRDTVLCGPIVITRETRAMDVRGWDSLSHTIILLGLEDSFGVRLPMEQVMKAATVGDLVDLVVELKAGPVK